MCRAQNLNETVLYTFTTNSYDGNIPGAVILGKDGSLYGITSNGGTNTYGVLFQINRNGSGYHILHAFDYLGGAYPLGVVQATNGFLYGITSTGGSNFNGTIFKINTNGTGYAQLHAMSAAEGIDPSSVLFPGSNAIFYGVAAQGGISNAGTVYRIALDGSGFQVLHHFTNSPDAANPVGVIQGADGMLYGASHDGGTAGFGAVFKLSTNGNSYSILHSFTNSPDGESPGANLVQGKDGMLYGTTVFGGSNLSFGGTLFKINTNGSGYAVLHHFPSINGDGINPGALTVASDGTIYGVGFNSGGPASGGMFFKLDTNGSFAVAYDFTTSPPDGKNPLGPLLEAGDGAFYGSTANGGTNNKGILFRLAPPLMLTMQSTNASGTNTAIFSWPAWAYDYHVGTSTSMNSNATWTALSAPGMSGSKLFVTNKSTVGNAFFRLQTGP